MAHKKSCIFFFRRIRFFIENKFVITLETLATFFTLNYNNEHIKNEKKKQYKKAKRQKVV